MYLVRTTARSGNVTHPVAVVLKICRAWPAADREPIAHELRERLLDVFRFEREAELYASGILEALPPGLAAPACFGIDRDEGRAALWLEYVEEERLRLETLCYPARAVPAAAAAALTAGRRAGAKLIPFCRS